MLGPGRDLWRHVGSILLGRWWMWLSSWKLTSAWLWRSATAPHAPWAARAAPGEDEQVHVSFRSELPLSPRPAPARSWPILGTHSCPGFWNPVCQGEEFPGLLSPHQLQWSCIKLSTLTVCTISKALVLIDTCLKKGKGRKPRCHQSSQKCLNLQNRP